MAPALEVKNLSKSFEGRGADRRTVLSEVSLAIAPGEFICVVGASGCGKTTFLRLVAGLAAPDGGEIRVGGHPIHGPGPDRGLVFQHDSLLPWRRVVDNVVFGLELQGASRKAALTRAAELIELVGLADAAELFPHELSGGMRQRVNLARALAIDPDILLMDEPFAALDAQTREIMQRELLKIWAQRRKTVLFITHQIDEAIYLADRVLVFGARPGRVVADIAVPFARPRALPLKRTPAFLGLMDEVWTLIEAEATRAATSVDAGS
ncbi:ABC transporter ATP-binding protein [Xanthobacter sp. V4C-4]|uniref:ABC transporter ATP-binding protein n=1 Tax=Xanthobacter cornucopiae TaxID=3119924 RepID=UPI00372986A2